MFATVRCRFGRKTLTNLLTDCGMAKAGREVKDALGRNSVFINGVAKGAEDNMSTRIASPLSMLFMGASF